MQQSDHEAGGQDIAAAAQTLRDRSRRVLADPNRVIAALARVGEIWEARVGFTWNPRMWIVPERSDWTPPDGSPFPWAQVCLSVAALVPGLKAAGEWRERVDLSPPAPLSGTPWVGAREGGVSSSVLETAITLPPTSTPPSLAPQERGAGGERFPVAALLLAGNTPLLSWSPLCACLLAGWGVFVKMSRDETLWTRLFVETLAEADPEVAACIHLDVWPGEDPRTSELCRAADAVIAYGSDTTIAALRAATPEATPFFGYGHAVSINIVKDGAGLVSPFGFKVARDVLMYGQEGCLSPHVVILDVANICSMDGERISQEFFLECAQAYGRQMRRTLQFQTHWLEVPAVDDPAKAQAIRNARDVAHFNGATVYGDDKLRWTVVVYPEPRIVEPPVGHCVIQIVLVEDFVRDFPKVLGPMQGYLTGVGVAGELTPEGEAKIRAEGVSRICQAGAMQMPPLDWPNGNRDLLAELLRLRR